jgi:hypothetical protein
MGERRGTSAEGAADEVAEAGSGTGESRSELSPARDQWSAWERSVPGRPGVPPASGEDAPHHRADAGAQAGTPAPARPDEAPDHPDPAEAQQEADVEEREAGEDGEAAPSPWSIPLTLVEDLSGLGEEDDRQPTGPDSLADKGGTEAAAAGTRRAPEATSFDVWSRARRPGGVEKTQTGPAEPDGGRGREELEEVAQASADAGAAGASQVSQGADGDVDVARSRAGGDTNAGDAARAPRDGGDAGADAVTSRADRGPAPDWGPAADRGTDVAATRTGGSAAADRDSGEADTGGDAQAPRADRDAGTDGAARAPRADGDADTDGAARAPRTEADADADAARAPRTEGDAGADAAARASWADGDAGADGDARAPKASGDLAADRDGGQAGVGGDTPASRADGDAGDGAAAGRAAADSTTAPADSGAASGTKGDAAADTDANDDKAGAHAGTGSRTAPGSVTATAGPVLGTAAEARDAAPPAPGNAAGPPSASGPQASDGAQASEGAQASDGAQAKEAAGGPATGRSGPPAGTQKDQGRAGRSQTPEGNAVVIVPGVARYHRSACILIRFLGADDLETSTVREAEANGCVPCRACEPQKPLSDGS